MHQVMAIGNKTLIDCLINQFKADIHVKTHKQLSIMHCAAQHYTGYLSILILAKQHDFDVNVRDEIEATPMHFAILKCEFKNVELLIKFGADLDAQDNLGQSPLHIAVMRIGQDPDSFDEYKNIIKELLFNGANRSLRTKSGHTPYELFLGLESELEPAEFKSLCRTLSS